MDRLAGCWTRPTDQSRLRLVEHQLRSEMGGGRGALVSEKWHRCRSSLSRERARSHRAADRRYCDGRHVRNDYGCAALARRGTDFDRELPELAAVSPGGASRDRTVADLMGKRVGVAGFGLGAHRGAQIMLAKLGLNPDTDVTMLQIGGDPTRLAALLAGTDRKSTRLNSSHSQISYAVFCLKKKKK